MESSSPLPPPPAQPPQPPSAGRNWLACALIAFFGFVVLAGVAVVVGVFAVGSCGLDLFADQVRRDIENNPVVLEQLGDITDIETDFVASANEPGGDVFVFRLEGTKGSGRLTAVCITVDDETESVTWGRLRMDSGEEFDLFEDQGPKPTS